MMVTKNGMHEEEYDMMTGSAEDPVRVTPTAARIYLSGCVVTFAGTATVHAGQQDVVVDCLVDGFSEDSIQVRIPEGTELLSVSVIHPKVASRNLDEARAEVVGIEQRISRVDKKIETRREQRERWLSPALGGSSKEDFSALVTYLDGLSGHLDAIDDEMLSLEKERKELSQELEDAKGRMHEIAMRFARGFLSMRIQSEANGMMPFEISMRSSKASWKPMHDVFVPDFVHPMSVRMRAEIRQDTGIDWEGVSLVLSTARPSIGQALPRLRHMVVQYDVGGRRQMAASGSHMSDRHAPTGAVYQRAMAKSISREMMAAGNEGVAPAMAQATPMDAQPLGVDPTELANSREYEVPGIWDVPGDEATVVDIRMTEVGATYRWLAYPTVTDEVHIVVEPDKPLDSVIIGDEVAVHIGNEYCGKVRVPRTEQGKEAVLSLGPDSMMTASSTQSMNKTRGGSLLRNRRILAYACDLEVKSRRKDAVPLSVIATVPVSEDGDVTVTLSDGFNGTFDERTGEVRWDATVCSNGTVTRRLEYEVSYPKNGFISMVPRD